MLTTAIPGAQMPRAPEPQLDQAAIRRADAEYARTELHILQGCSPGYVYNAPSDARTQHAPDIMTAEGYLVRIRDSYAITAKGRDYRNRLQRGKISQWLRDNWHWAVTTTVAAASVIVAVAAVIVAASSS